MRQAQSYEKIMHHQFAEAVKDMQFFVELEDPLEIYARCINTAEQEEMEQSLLDISGSNNFGRPISLARLYEIRLGAEIKLDECKFDTGVVDVVEIRQQVHVCTWCKKPCAKRGTAGHTCTVECNAKRENCADAGKMERYKVKSERDEAPRESLQSRERSLNFISVTDGMGAVHVFTTRRGGGPRADHVFKGISVAIEDEGTQCVVCYARGSDLVVKLHCMAACDGCMTTWLRSQMGTPVVRCFCNALVLDQSADASASASSSTSSSASYGDAPGGVFGDADAKRDALTGLVQKKGWLAKLKGHSRVNIGPANDGHDMIMEFTTSGVVRCAPLHRGFRQGGFRQAGRRAGRCQEECEARRFSRRFRRCHQARCRGQDRGRGHHGARDANDRELVSSCGGTRGPATSWGAAAHCPCAAHKYLHS